MTYKLMGYAVLPQESNESTPSLEEQQTTPPEIVVYETEDIEEAKSILNAGGYTDDNEVYHVVNEIKFDATEAGGEVSAAGPGIGKSEMLMGAAEDAVPPQNSTAEINPATGAVRTDPGKRPVEPEDIQAMIEADAAVVDAVPRKSEILP